MQWQRKVAMEERKRFIAELMRVADMEWGDERERIY